MCDKSGKLEGFPDLLGRKSKAENDGRPHHQQPDPAVGLSASLRAADFAYAFTIRPCFHFSLILVLQPFVPPTSVYCSCNPIHSLRTKPCRAFDYLRQPSVNPTSVATTCTYQSDLSQPQRNWLRSRDRYHHPHLKTTVASAANLS